MRRPRRDAGEHQVFADQSDACVLVGVEVAFPDQTFLNRVVDVRVVAPAIEVVA